jgi:ABC-type transport system involved in multi-copper enzyme maturation permease subunit
MIKLINNEFKKIGFFKLCFPFIIFLIVIILIFEVTDDMKNTIDNLIPFVGIMVSIIFSGIISNEIENGTIRFYLTKPISRNKIFQSKFITIIIYTKSKGESKNGKGSACKNK